MLRPLLLSVAAFATSAHMAASHEFWIEPIESQVAPDGEIVASIRVGQDFGGASYSFLPPKFVRFDYALGDTVEPVPGTIGDRPAVTMPAPGEGLVTLIHVTTDTTLTYSDFSKFQSFVTHKDARFALDAHAERGLSEEGVREVYSRYAKALVAVGDGEGEDEPRGLLTEIVALENPYTDQTSDGVDVLLLYEGEPRANAQIEVFEKSPDDMVTKELIHTDADGHATVPVRPGHRYMLDAVVIREPSPEKAEATNTVWESLWANLTFAVPQ